METKIHDELQWLLGNHWVKFDGSLVVQGFHPVDSNRIVEGVEQVHMRVIDSNGSIEIWHKRGRTHWASLGHQVYEPAALLVVQKTDDVIDGYRRYQTVKITRTNLGLKQSIDQLMKDNYNDAHL